MGNYTQETAPTRLTKAKGTNFAREIFTSNFWMSGLAMLRYIPRSFRVKQVDGMAFYTDAKHDEFRNRVFRTTPANPRQWGTMSVAPSVAGIVSGSCVPGPCQHAADESKTFRQGPPDQSAWTLASDSPRWNRSRARALEA